MVISLTNSVDHESPMLYTKIQPQSLFGFCRRIFLDVFNIYGHGGQLDLRTEIICKIFQSSFNRSLHMKFEENWPRGFRGEVQVGGRTTTANDHNGSSRAFCSGVKNSVNPPKNL